MNYRNSSLTIEERVKDLISHMTLDEKIAQLSSTKMGDFISDVSNFIFSLDLAKKNVPDGCGYIGRIGGATDLLPHEMASIMNKIQKYFVEETRLGIPVIFMTEGTSGVLSRNHTLFPQNIGAGAMFNEELIEEMANAIRKEMTATGERMALAPVVDVIRDHRYGRYEESFGEDVYLVTQCGKSYTKGLQSEDLKEGVAATLKHFVAQGISDGGRNCGPVHITDKEILDSYAVPFEAAINEADAAAVMAAYHEIDQIPCHASSKILRDILRDKLGFKGLTVSDGNGIQLVRTFQEYCETLEETVKLTMEAGIDCELDYMFKAYLKNLCLEGSVKKETVDEAVTKILSLKFQLGLFDKPYVEEELVNKTVCCEAHIETSKKMALQSMTLLKNENNILPLSTNLKSIAVVGPLANKKEFAYSDYSYPTHIEDMYYSSEGLTEEEVLARTLFFKKKETKFEDLFHDTKTIYEIVKESVSPETEVLYAEGLKDTYNYHKSEDFYRIEEAVETAAKAEVIIAVCGDTSGMGRENDSGESVDRTEISLSKEQRKLLKALKALGKPIVLVLCNARPLEVLYESENMEAILEAWKPGMKGAEAICDVLFGKYNPAGRLPVTLPKALGQLPMYYSQLATGKKQFWRNTYLEMDLNPLYEFGFGLSYTIFNYDKITMTQQENGINVKADITNTGEHDGEEVVQIYVRKKYTSVLQPEKELKAYKRVFVKKGQKVSVEFEIDFGSLCYYNLENNLVLENSVLDVMIGSSSQKIHGEQSFKLRFENDKKVYERRTFTNSCR
jgi:beta-glucosidase